MTKEQTVSEQDTMLSADSSIDAVENKALVRRIDFRLLPILFIVYVVAFLDRVNISNALTMGLPQDLGLKGNQANIALTIFFVPYVLFELPSNIFLKRFRPSVWLGACTMAFGLVMLAQGFVKNFGGLLATRFFLGVAEAGVFPGSFYLISFWYKREESQIRFAIFWSSVLVASAFGGLLASALANLDGVQGLENWRWIFILEGLATILVGILAYFVIPDFPEQVTWLSESEKELVQSRTEVLNEGEQLITLRVLGSFFADPKKLLGAFMYFGIVVPVYAYAYFAPTIIKGLGYNVVQTQLRSVPPVAAALVLCLSIAFISDWARIRSPFVAFGIILTVSGLSTLIAIHNNFSVQYAGLCLVAMGAFTAGIVIVCWYVMNLHGHVDRSIGTAWMISFGNTGGIVAAFTFRSSDAPYYRTGYSICLGAICLSGVASIAYTFCIWRERQASKKTQGEAKQVFSL